MSIITANHSLADYQARTKSNSRHQRNYQRVSHANLDQNAIAAYLRSQQLHKTLSTFLQQSSSNRTVSPILQIFVRGGQNYTGTAQQYWKIIQKAIIEQNKGLSNKEIQVKKAKMAALQLYIYIWHCVTDSGIHSQRVNILKQFITAKGSTLSQNAELLPYFALPYVQKVSTHSFLKKVFSQSWRSEVKKLLLELIKPEGEVESMEQEWFNIITDLIEICQHLAKEIKMDGRNAHLQAMIERVALYKTVVEQNQQQKRLAFQLQASRRQQVNKQFQIKVNSLSELRNGLSKLSEQAGKQNSEKALYQANAIYSKLQVQINKRYRKGMDKQYINEMIQRDILLLKEKPSLIMGQLGWIKLVQILSSYFKCRSYFIQHPQLIAKTVQIIEKCYFDNTTPNRTILLYMGFDILQKLTVRRQLFLLINTHSIIPKIAFDLLKQLQAQFQNSQQSSLLFEAILVWIVNTVMHRKGISKIAPMPLFQTVLSILSRLPKTDDFLIIQSLICSIIYLLLVQQSIRQRAIRLNLKEVLLERMVHKKNESFDNIVKYMIQRIDNDQQKEEIDSDQDVEKDKQFDQHLALEEEKGGQSTSKALTNKDENNEVKIGSLMGKEEYRRERYSWKNSK